MRVYRGGYFGGPNKASELDPPPSGPAAGAVSDEQMFRDFLVAVGQLDPTQDWPEDVRWFLVADARNRLDVTKGGRLSNEAKP